MVEFLLHTILAIVEITAYCIAVAAVFAGAEWLIGRR